MSSVPMMPKPSYKTGMTSSILPVIHYLDDDQALRNADRAFEAGCDGVFIIDMQGRNVPIPLIATRIKKRWPDRQVGINLLGVRPSEALRISLISGLDMTWTDEQLTHSDLGGNDLAEARQAKVLLSATHGHLLFSGVAFKYQTHDPRPDIAAIRAMDFGFIPTTSGPSTGVAAEKKELEVLRNAVGTSGMLAVASGVTPENAGDLSPLLSHVLVATGVSSSFYEFDPARLSQLVTSIQTN